MTRVLAALFALLAPVAVTAADDDNPYKNTKVGDYATYKMDLKFGDLAIPGTMTATVTAKTEKEATITVTGKINNMDIPPQEQKIDLTKPYDPTKFANLPGGGEAKVEKLKDGKEKVKAGGKEYDAEWTTYKVAAKAQGADIAANIKVWMAKEVTLGMLKMEMTAELAGQKLALTMNVTETGNKSK